MSDHLCPGPDGGNLLGFLASVGALSTLSRAWRSPEVQMSWAHHAGRRPMLHVTGESTEGEIVDAIDSELRRPDVALVFDSLGDDLPVEPERFASVAAEAAKAATPADRRWADFMASFRCEATLGRGGKIQDTALSGDRGDRGSGGGVGRPAASPLRLT